MKCRSCSLLLCVPRQKWRSIQVAAARQDHHPWRLLGARAARSPDATALVRVDAHCSIPRTSMGAFAALPPAPGEDLHLTLQERSRARKG